MPAPFHLAIPVDDLAAARAFYGQLLGCPEGRSSSRWVDFDFWGHQLTVHLHAAGGGVGPTSEVDGKAVPVRHFGLVMPWEDWGPLSEKLQGQKVDFVIEPYLRFKGEVGEQATMFFRDPSGNMIEIKSFKDPARIFAR